MAKSELVDRRHHIRVDAVRVTHLVNSLLKPYYLLDTCAGADYVSSMATRRTQKKEIRMVDHAAHITTTVELPKVLYEALRRIAAAERRSVRQQIVVLLAESILKPIV